MASRLGQVLYWIGCVIALALTASYIAILIASREPVRVDSEMVWIGALVFLAPAAIAWLIGRACKYILVGK